MSGYGGADRIRYSLRLAQPYSTRNHVQLLNLGDLGDSLKRDANLSSET